MTCDDDPLDRDFFSLGNRKFEVKPVFADLLDLCIDLRPPECMIHVKIRESLQVSLNIWLEEKAPFTGFDLLEEHILTKNL